MKAKEYLNKNRDWDFRCPITEFGVAKIMTEYAEAQNKSLEKEVIKKEGILTNSVKETTEIIEDLQARINELESLLEIERKHTKVIGF